MSSQLLAESLARNPRFNVSTVVPPPRILSLPPTNRPGVAVISAELDSQPTKGMHLARALRARNRSLSIVILLEFLEREKVIASFRSGAKGVFCRTEPVLELHTCIEQVSKGMIWSGNVESEYLIEAIQSAPTCDGLGELNRITAREAEVAELAAHGLNNKQIAARLGLSEHTVKNHLFRIFDKLNVANRIELLFLMINARDSHSGELALRLLSQDRASEPPVATTADDRVVAQLRLGLAHLEGRGMKKDDCAAYHWLRMAEVNSSRVLEQSRSGLNELRSRLESKDIQELEQQLAYQVSEQVDRKMTQAREEEPGTPSICKLAA